MLRQAIALASLLLAACGDGASTRRGVEPFEHLVLITIDTLRADRLGAYGHAAARTPHLDALASRGARFEDAIAQAVVTPPSHASIFTGLTPPTHGLSQLTGQRLAEEHETLAERRERGIPYHPKVIGWFRRTAEELGVAHHLG